MISLILPTLGERNKEIKILFDSLENQKNKNFEVIVVSQDNHKKVDEYLIDRKFDYKHIKINQKGLSKARNEGLKNAQGNIIGFSDDDCWYAEDAFEFIESYFKKNNCQIATFQHYDLEMKEYPKKYPREAIKFISKRDILWQASIDIFLNTELVKDFKIGFDERFGVGGIYKSGEENIYLMDLYNKNYTIEYYPKIISYHPNKIKNEKLNEKYIKDKAPLFKRLFGSSFGLLIYIVFLIRKFKQINNFKYCVKEGIKEYRNLKI